MTEPVKRVEGNCTNKSVQLQSTGKIVTRIKKTPVDHRRFTFLSDSPQWARIFSFMMFLDHTQRRTTLGRTSLDERSALRRDLYLKTYNTHNRQKSIPSVGFEPTISAGERPQKLSLRPRGRWDRHRKLGWFRGEKMSTKHRPRSW